ncbi:MAG: hypothetical protein WCO13_14125 [Bacteroidota bacterium]
MNKSIDPFKLFEYNPENVERQLNWIDTLSTTITEIGKTYDGVKGSKIGGIRTFVFLDILQRINYNLEGLVQLYNQFIVQEDMRFPINMLFRGCLSDVLTGLYFLHFFEDENSFINEINVMNLDFAKFSKFIIENEPYIIKTIDEEKIEEFIQFNKEKYIKSNPVLFRSENDWEIKKALELRTDSVDKFFINAKNKNGDINESTKFDVILSNENLKHLTPTYLLFRYFSQYQHYSFNGRKTLIIDTEYDIQKYFVTIMMINESIHMFCKIIGVKDEMLVHLREIADEYINLSSE